MKVFFFFFFSLTVWGNGNRLKTKRVIHMKLPNNFLTLSNFVCVNAAVNVY